MKMDFRKLDEATTPAEMRAAIEKGQYDSALIRNVLMAGRCAGMSAEDTYTLLAYHALQTMVAYQNQCLELASLSPRPFVMQVDKDGKPV